jgi:hypothetical protein
MTGKSSSRWWQFGGNQNILIEKSRKTLMVFTLHNNNMREIYQRLQMDCEKYLQLMLNIHLYVCE